MQSTDPQPIVPPVKIGERKKLQGIVHKYTPNENGDYVCMYCPKTSRKQSTISEHISRVHPTEAGRQKDPFECPTCLMRFNSASIRDQHIQTHHAIDAKTRCQYPNCTYEGKHEAALQTHYVRKHMPFETLISRPSKTEAICNTCNACMNAPSIVYHVGRCNPLSPFCKISTKISTKTKTPLIKTPSARKKKDKNKPDNPDADDDDFIMVANKSPLIQSKIPDRLELPCNDYKPQRPLYHCIIQSAISDRLESIGDVLKPERHVYIV